MNNVHVKPNVIIFRSDHQKRNDFSLKIETKRRDIYADYYSGKKPYAVIYGEAYQGEYTPETLEKLALSKFNGIHS